MTGILFLICGILLLKIAKDMQTTPFTRKDTVYKAMAFAGGTVNVITGLYLLFK